MAKPAFYLVFVSGRFSERFTMRAGARIYAAAQKALGHSVIIKPQGF
jgi:hypothetical protein